MQIEPSGNREKKSQLSEELEKVEKSQSTPLVNPDAQAVSHLGEKKLEVFLDVFV